MIIYIPSSVAQSLSSALWALARPPALQSGNRTKYLFGWIVATDGTTWLEVDTEFQIRVHADAELGAIADILQPWIDAGKLPADTGTQLATLLDSKRGQRVVIYDVFPQLFKDMAKTHKQMVEAGLLADSDEQ
jgi:hypothetical protein